MKLTDSTELRMLNAVLCWGARPLNWKPVYVTARERNNTDSANNKPLVILKGKRFSTSVTDIAFTARIHTKDTATGNDNRQEDPELRAQRVVLKAASRADCSAPTG